MAEVKKFVDQEGIKYLWSKMDNYPTNDTLITIVNAIDETKADKENVAFISEDESNEDILVETNSPYAGTIHRFTVEINCAPMYIPEDNLGPEFFDNTEMYTDYGVLIFP
jgi:hypothetical protein